MNNELRLPEGDTKDGPVTVTYEPWSSPKIAEQKIAEWRKNNPDTKKFVRQISDYKGSKERRRRNNVSY
ncbi:MAG: hypothetical protein M0R49_01075 [Limnochordia bacterium]|nr:hypothetical protein [Limnochordia bacterium]